MQTKIEIFKIYNSNRKLIETKDLSDEPFYDSQNVYLFLVNFNDWNIIKIL